MYHPVRNTPGPLLRKSSQNTVGFTCSVKRDDLDDHDSTADGNARQQSHTASSAKIFPTAFLVTADEPFGVDIVATFEETFRGMPPWQ